LEERDDRTGAERAYGRADRLGHAAAAGNLGVLLAEQGQVGAAEAAFRRADERGDPNAGANLAALGTPAGHSESTAPPRLASRPGAAAGASSPVRLRSRSQRTRALRRGPVLALGASALLALVFAAVGVGALSGGGSSAGPAAPTLTHAVAAIASSPDTPSPGIPAREPRSSHRSHDKPAARARGHRGGAAARRSVRVQKSGHNVKVSHRVTSHRSPSPSSVPAATPVVTSRPTTPVPVHVVQTTPPPAPTPSAPTTPSPPRSSDSGAPAANSGSGGGSSGPTGSGSASGGDLSGAGSSGSSGSGNASGGG
jgi:hypothetical protein